MTELLCCSSLCLRSTALPSAGESRRKSAVKSRRSCNRSSAGRSIIRNSKKSNCHLLRNAKQSPSAALRQERALSQHNRPRRRAAHLGGRQRMGKSKGQRTEKQSRAKQAIRRCNKRIVKSRAGTRSPRNNRKRIRVSENTGNSKDIILFSDAARST